MGGRPARGRRGCRGRRAPAQCGGAGARREKAALPPEVRCRVPALRPEWQQRRQHQHQHQHHPQPPGCARWGRGCWRLPASAAERARRAGSGAPGLWLGMEPRCNVRCEFQWVRGKRGCGLGSLVSSWGGTCWDPCGESPGVMTRWESGWCAGESSGDGSKDGNSVLYSCLHLLCEL